MKDQLIIKKRPIELFLIEDNLGDAVLIQETLKASTFPIHVAVSRDGEEALDHLRHYKDFSSRSHPDLILLDLNLPKKDGREVLAEIKEDPRLNNIPVVIMTSSQAQFDMESAYEHKANFYIVKPQTLSGFFSAIKHLEDFWLKNIA
jgi:two-component system, chemotaxis family, response regulator Rcp1